VSRAEWIDARRAAAALLAAVADDDPGQAAAILGAEPGQDHAAGIAWALAQWFSWELRAHGTDPERYAAQIIAGSVRDEARGAGP
jgi:hypothetical protein